MSHTAMIPYGAFEIKRCYQANLLIGIVVAIVIAFLPLVFSSLFPAEPIVNVIVDHGHGDAPADTFYFQPPPVTDPGIPVNDPKGSTMDYSAIGIPVPVSDDAVKNDSTSIGTIDDLKRMNEPDGKEGGTSNENGSSGSGVYQALDTTERIPPADVFIPRESEPEPINEVDPEYPRLALEAGFTAKLIMEAYVDRAGTVKAMRVASCSRAGMGFEEAAMAAGYKVKYRPAIQNGNPVGVWVSYKVEFKTMK
jgi:TonB family protein